MSGTAFNPLASNFTTEIAVINANDYSAVPYFVANSTGVYVNGVEISSVDIGYVDGITPGTVTASKAVVVDASKNISQVGTLGVNALNVGLPTGTAGVITIYPGTTTTGKTTITMSANSGNTTTNLNVAAQAAARSYSIIDAGTDASFVMTAANQTIAGNKTLSGTTVLSGTTSVTSGVFNVGVDGTAGVLSILAGTTNTGKVTITTSDNSGNTTTNINVATQAAARTLTIPDPGGSTSFIMGAGTQTLTGATTFSGGVTASALIMGDGESARSIGMTAKTGDAAANGLTLAASSALADTATNRAGGTLTLAAGNSTGTAISSIVLSTSSAGGSGTSANVVSPAVTIDDLGNVTHNKIGGTTVVKQGSNGKTGTFVLNGATPVTVSNTSITANSIVIPCLKTVGGVVSPTLPNVQTITASTGFTVAGVAADTSTYNYIIFESAA